MATGRRSRGAKPSGLWYAPAGLSVFPRQRRWRIPRAVEKLILPGWIPERPPLKRSDRVMAVGSCFARQLAYALYERGQSHGDIGLFVFDGRLTTTFAMVRHFEWALGLREIEEDETIFVEDASRVGMVGCKQGAGGLVGARCVPIPLDQDTRRRTRAVIEGSDAFILTFGLSEMWFDRRSGEAFIKAVPALVFDAKLHQHRVTSVEENRQNIERLIEIIRVVKPRAPIVLTLSPQPLVATFRPVSCVTANCVSKSILRVAIDEVVRATPEPHIYYWPSYEIAMVYHYGPRAFVQHDGRHIRPEIAKEIVALFDRYFIEEDKNNVSSQRHEPGRRQRSPRRRALAAKARRQRR